MCKDCNHQFVAEPKWRRISDETKALIDKQQLEKISLAGVARVTGVSEPWLQAYVNAKYAAVERTVQVSAKKRRLILECDELWSFVGRKLGQHWLALALDRETREIEVVAIGARDRATARMLWASLPAVYRQCAICYSDFWEAYVGVLPSKRHRAIGKESGQTNHVERVNNTLCQRIGRLVRKTLAFSKKLANHIGAI
jgi:insertion element IS1 protein InsB